MTPLWQQFSTKHSCWLRSIVLVTVLNAAFPLLLLLASLVPTDVSIDRIQRAFATGELDQSDYLKYDARRGFHQYNDCNILQMISNQDSSRVGKALGPWLHMADDSAEGACPTLQELVVNGRNPDSFVSSRYTRYWHGYIPILSILLIFLEISTIREILRVGVYIAVLLTLLASIRNRYFLALTGPVAIAGVFFWGLPYFGLGLSHAPGDIVVMLGIAWLIFWHRKFANADKLIPFCSLFGAIVVFFEMLTGPLPIAAGLLFPTVYLLSRLTNRSDNLFHHFRLASFALLAFALGAIITVGARVLIAATSVHPNGLDAIAGNLSLYTQPVDSSLWVPGFVRPFGRLLRRGAVLTYGSSLGLAALYMSVAMSWFAGMWLAYQRASRSSWTDLSAFAIGAASVPVWTFILQTHTFMHADFMARILIVPISLGWAAMLWQVVQKFNGETSSR